MTQQWGARHRQVVKSVVGWRPSTPHILLLTCASGMWPWVPSPSQGQAHPDAVWARQWWPWLPVSSTCPALGAESTARCIWAASLYDPPTPSPMMPWGAQSPGAVAPACCLTSGTHENDSATQRGLTARHPGHDVGLTRRLQAPLQGLLFPPQSPARVPRPGLWRLCIIIPLTPHNPGPDP